MVLGKYKCFKRGVYFMIYNKIKNIFLFVIVFASFNAICMEDNSNCINPEKVLSSLPLSLPTPMQVQIVEHELKEANSKSPLLLLDKVDIMIHIADIRQNLLELAGENCNKISTYEPAAKKVIALLSKKNYEEDDVFKKLISIDGQEDPIVGKNKKTEKDIILIKAVLEKYRNTIIIGLKRIYE